jgi:hypothetical protein
MEKSQEWLDAGLCIGRQQAFAIIATKCSAAQAQCLKQLTESGAHEMLGLTWEEFCPQYTGICRATADRIIQQYDEFGEAYFKLSSLAQISPETYRHIANRVDAETIEVAGEPVALTEENGPKIRAHIQTLRAQIRAERRRTEPGLQELQSRLDDVLAEASRLIGADMPADRQAALCGLALDAARKWAKVARDVERVMHPAVPQQEVEAA